ncbi:hypothetical protein [Haloferula sp. BvORR071]|uniref:hypothetical protein n=1 Tax=Haloferula sp. BvORR071 TaxID=1396141 RepID=UPI00055170DE|nr:hypothetical protein [Haloferula sp. BvORR071]
MKMTSHTNSRNALIACAIALSGAASAGVLTPGAAAFAAADVDVSSALNKAEFTTTLEVGASAKTVNRQLAKADLSKNGSISLVEYLVFVGEQESPGKEALSFADADGNHNLSLDINEFYWATLSKAPIIAMIKNFRIADTDDNHLLSLEEWTLFKQGKAKPEPGTRFLKFDLADYSEDNKLSLEEFSYVYPRGAAGAKVTAKFAKLDANEDAVLTRDEWNPGGPKAPL